jgi:hypothetical protein
MVVHRTNYIGEFTVAARLDTLPEVPGFWNAAFARRHLRRFERDARCSRLGSRQST